jgi:predicted transcriptional regulator
MPSDHIIKYLNNNALTAYHVSKETGVSINTINDFIDGKRIPRKSTIDKFNLFIEAHIKNTQGINAMKRNLSFLAEKREVSNNEILEALNEIGGALLQNSGAITELLIETHENTKQILINSTQLGIKNLEEITKKLKEKQNE